MIDIVALWVGRVVLGLMALVVALIVIGVFIVGVQVVFGGMSRAWKEIKAARKSK